MSCALTSGFTLGCKDSVGGIKHIHIANFSSITYDAIVGGEVANVTGTFFKYELPINTATFTETVTSSETTFTTFYTTELTIQLPKLTAQLRNELKLLAQSKLALVATDRNGTQWIIGKENGVYLTTGTSVTGTAMGDMNGMNLTFTANETDPICVLEEILP
jgi:hypothetical protein